MYAVTILDVAKRANVSIATVNRAIYNKGRISNETKERIARAITELGYKPNKAAKSLSRKVIRIGMLVYSLSGYEYANDVIKGARNAFDELLDLKVEGDIFFASGAAIQEKKSQLLDKIKQYIQEEYAGLIVCAPAKALEGEALNMLRQFSSVITVVNDIPESDRIFCVRTDEKVAGMIAAELLWRFSSNKTAVIFTGSRDIQIQNESIVGFMENSIRYPLRLLGVYENHDDPDIAYYTTGKLLKEYPDVGGIYVNTTNSATVCKRIKEAGLGGKVQLVASDIYPEMIGYLQEGTVCATLFKDPFAQGKLAVKSLYKYLTGELGDDDNIFIKPQIVINSNIELYSDFIEHAQNIKGLTGRIIDLQQAEPVPPAVEPLDAAPSGDIDLERMAQWAMNYLVRTPRKEFDYEPVFQCNLMKCPPIPEGHDVVVPCDTDARLNWEWYYMREISGSDAGLDVEAGFHSRMLGYVREDGSVISHPGAFNEYDIYHKYKEEEYGIHIWGATKILHALAEDFRRTGNAQSLVIARKIMLRLKSLAIYPEPGKCYLAAGLGMLRADGTPVPNNWNRIPAPLVEPLVNYYMASGDAEALKFAREYAEGIMAGAQPGGIMIKENGDIDGGQSHTTMHAIWGIAHLGVITGERRYTEFARRSFDYMLGQGTGTGWFPAMPEGDGIDETCMCADMMSNAAMIARGGYPSYFDYVERYLRNRISPSQFIITPEFEAEYRALNSTAGEENVRQGLDALSKFQGGFRTYLGLNDLENTLLNTSYVSLAGCCVPEGMRSIYTAWSHVIDRYPESALGPAGVYVNMSLKRKSPWGQVFSFMPHTGRLGVKAAAHDAYFLRPPHWAAQSHVKAYVNLKEIPVRWSGEYVQFDSANPGDELVIVYPLIRFRHVAGGTWKHIIPGVTITYDWLGNMVTAVNPPAAKTPIFTGKIRQLPDPPALS